MCIHLVIVCSRFNNYFTFRAGNIDYFNLISIKVNCVCELFVTARYICSCLNRIINNERFILKNSTTFKVVGIETATLLSI